MPEWLGDGPPFSVGCLFLQFNLLFFFLGKQVPYLMRTLRSMILGYIINYNHVSCRLGNDESTGQSTSGLFVCAVCQVDLAPSEGISVHAGSIFSTSSKPWQGPFLCADCRNKKDAMEGKRPSGVKVTQLLYCFTPFFTP